MKNLKLAAPAVFALALLSQGAIAADGPPVVVPPPPAGKGQVVFFRPSAMGMAIKCTVREGGKMIGRVGNGRYFVHVTDPGAHTYTTKTEATDTLATEVEADETQYVKCKIGMGFMAGRPNLSPADKAAFDEKSPNLKPQDAAKMAEEIAEDEAEQAAPKPQ